MKARMNFTTLIVLISFKFILNCYALNSTENGLCTFETVDGVPNICDRADHLVFVSESENGCRRADNKCWCILIDNRNRTYDGDMTIELMQTLVDLYPDKNQLGFAVKSYLTFKISAGLNRILVQPYSPPEALIEITSIKIQNNEICRFTNTTPLQIIDVQQPTNNKNITVTPNEYYSNHSLIDCMHRQAYTDYSTKFCPNYRPEFIIEKRSALNNQVYWCIIINNDNNALTSANHLHIVYPSSNRVVHFPLDAYAEGDFQLGNRKTFIALSEKNNQLLDLNSVTIDDQPICNYFEPHVTIAESTTSAATATIPKPDLPSNLDFPSITKPGSSMKSCGIKAIHQNSLINFDSNTKPGDWPWHAAIYKLQTKINRIFVCGGTLIDQKTIVTAAHCIIENNQVVIPERLTVDLGRSDLTLASSATQEYRVYDIILHEAYNPESFENDIAILILANFVELTQYVNFICLPHPNEAILNQLGTTVGWGHDQNNELQPNLKEAKLPVVDYIKCLASNREFFGQYLTNTNFCAGFMNNTNECHSGGGLVFKLNNQWVLGGITSLGAFSETNALDCDRSQYIIFTDVRKFVTWIKRML